jgi:hypothetical protein
MTARTSELLAVELDKVGLIGMAQMAREDKFHDFLSSLDDGVSALVEMLGVAAAGCPDAMRRMAMITLRDRVINGEFDADTAESEAWAESEDGQEAFNMLIKDK